MAKYLVVGAGVSGSALANLLSRNLNNEVLVIDRDNVIGGNCHDHRDEHGIMIHDYGSHIFHTSNKKVWDYLIQFTEFNTYQHRVLGLVEGNCVPIPFCLDTIQRVFPKTIADSLERKLLSRYKFGSKIPIKDFMTQDDLELQFLAYYVYENVFLHYTEKQWGKSPDEVDGAVTARVPVYVSRDTRYFQDAFQGIPLCGYTEMIRRMLNRPNITVLLNTDFNELDDTKKYDAIFYSGPVDELMGYRLGHLPYRSERFVLEVHNCEFYQDVAVVNYPNNYGFTRIHEYKHYLSDQSQCTVIAKEYPEEFIPGKNEPYYPVPGKENEDLHKEYVQLAKAEYPNMFFFGRLGDYRYYNMDQAIARAMDIAEAVLDKG